MNQRFAPLLDLREMLHWNQLLPVEVGTLMLWGVAAKLIMASAAIATGCTPVLASGLGIGVLLRFAQLGNRGKHSAVLSRLPAQIIPTRRLPLTAELLLSNDPAPVGRAQLARYFDVGEVSLFRGQHAAICTVSHDEFGRITALNCRPPLIALPSSDRHAHPVG